jgi:hypothetical protein
MPTYTIDRNNPRFLLVYARASRGRTTHANKTSTGKAPVMYYNDSNPFCIAYLGQHRTNIFYCTSFSRTFPLFLEIFRNFLGRKQIFPANFP